MANEKRVRQNFIGGLVDTADLAAAGTTFNSAGLAAITTVIDATNHFPITLDPDGIYGAPEVAYVTAYTVGATSATILRGQEGTTARQHLMDTPWVHGPTVRDISVGRAAATRLTGGNVLVSSASGWTAMSTTSDLAVTAFPGDLLEVTVAAFYGNENAEAGLDVCTMVGGAPVSSIGAGTVVGTNRAPLQATDQLIANYMGVEGSAIFQVAAADISGGKVTCRVYAIVYGTGVSRTVRASAGNPLQFFIKNLGPQEA